MKKKKPIEQEINAFFEEFGREDMLELLKQMFHVFELYDVDEDNGWLKDCIANVDDIENIRMIRTIYLLSKISDLYAGKLCLLKTKFKDLWRRMEESVK
jgi:hypothetical protein